MLSAIVQRVCGQPIRDYLQPRLFEPLHITDVRWESCPDGVSTGGWGLSLRTEDVAKLGQLYLQKGRWLGAPVIPECWAVEAVKLQQEQPPESGAELSDWHQGYGYQFWMCRHRAYRADGAFGQLCLVLPEQQAVLVITGTVTKPQEVLNAVWEHLLPSMGGSAPPPAIGLPLPRQLQISPPLGLERTFKRENRNYRLEDNEQHWQSLSFRWEEDDSLSVTVQAEGKQHTLHCAHLTWKTGCTSLSRNVLHGQQYPHVEMRVAASYTWSEAQELLLTWRFLETVYTDTLLCRLDKDRLTVRISVNVHQNGRTKLPLLVGYREE
jgi:hypothetical protein